MLAPTAEEAFTQVVADECSSYRDFGGMGLGLYQTGRKYRDEARPRYGLLRSREFVMFDLYSFHASDEDAQAYYAAVGSAYDRILRRVCSHADVPEALAEYEAGRKGTGDDRDHDGTRRGRSATIAFHRVSADTGEIGGSLSHEFHIGAGLGEDELISCSACGYAANVELHPGGVDACPKCDAPSSLSTHKGIEVGHIFYLGDKYSRPMSARFNPEGGGDLSYCEMGCYGIGVSRLLAALVEAEAGHDDNGIVWPTAAAPFSAVVLSTERGGDGDKASRRSLAARNAERFARELVRAGQMGDAIGMEELSERISGGGSGAAAVTGAGSAARPTLDVLLDERWEARMGEKMYEARLVGYPWMAVVSAESYSPPPPPSSSPSQGTGSGAGGGDGGKGTVELIHRKSGRSFKLPPSEAVAAVAASVVG